MAGSGYLHATSTKGPPFLFLNAYQATVLNGATIVLQSYDESQWVPAPADVSADAVLEQRFASLDLSPQPIEQAPIPRMQDIACDR